MEKINFCETFLMYGVSCANILIFFSLLKLKRVRQMCKQFTYRRNENLWPDFFDLIAYIVCQLDFYFLIQLLIAS